MSKKLGYAIMCGIIMAVVAGFLDWLITGNVSNLFQLIVFAGTFGICLLPLPDEPDEP